MTFSREIFEIYIKEAMSLLPEKFRKRITNLAVTIDEESTPRQKDKLLLANILRSTFYPSKITFFKKNIELISPSEESLRKNLKDIAYHEIGHYFLMSEKQLQKKENRKRGLKH